VIAQAWVEWFSDFDARREEAERELGISHRDGIPWYKAPVPHRWHRCSAQTVGLVDAIERCACGALRYTYGRGAGLWGERNSRKAK
jgi:hypothetical protein